MFNPKIKTEIKKELLEKMKLEYEQILPDNKVFDNTLSRIKNNQENKKVKSNFFFITSHRYISAFMTLVLVSAIGFGGYNYYKVKSFDNLITITESDGDLTEDETIQSIVENPDLSLFDDVISDIEL